GGARNRPERRIRWRSPMTTVGRTRLALALALLLIAAALPAAATARKAGGKPAGSVVTRSSTIQLPPHQVLTATATCPAATKAVGGGFSGSPAAIEPTVVTH